MADIDVKCIRVDKSSHHALTAGDGNCAYRALLMGLLEAAVAADDYTRQSLVQQVEKLYRGLPEWARSSFDGSSNVAHGYGVQMVRSFSRNQCLHGICMTEQSLWVPSISVFL